jgi:proteic killer suppression protein
MIKGVRCKRTEALFNDGAGDKKWRAFERVARRKLVMLDSAKVLSDLKAPPGNRLEPLKDDRAGQWAIRINGQYRVCFVWSIGEGAAYNVEIVDYH